MKLKATMEFEEVKKLLTSYIEKKTNKKVKDIEFDDQEYVFNVDLELNNTVEGDE